MAKGRIEKRTSKYSDYVPDSLARKEIEEIPIVKEIASKSEKRKFKFSVMTKVVILFALGLFVIFRFAQITELGYEINKVNSKREVFINENEKLKINIEKETNLSEIRKKAETDLNLYPPNDSQIIYINTSITDRTDYWESETEEDTNVFQDILKWLKEIIGIK